MATRNGTFKERRDVVIQGLRAVGLDVDLPKATFYVWAPIPEGFTSQDFCFKVLAPSTSGSFRAPCMEGGKGCSRIALTHPATRLAEAMRRLKEFMG